MTLQYEIKENGVEGVRLEPGQKGVAKPAQKLSASKAVEGKEEKREVEDVEQKTGGQGENQEIVEEVEEGTAEDVEVEETEDSEGQDITSTSPIQSNDGSSTAIQMNDLTISEPPSTSSPITTTSSDFPPATATSSQPTSSIPLKPAEEEEEDSESDAGEWITPSNVSTHRSRDLGHLPEGGKASQKEISAACMTGDFAVQNVLLAMGLGLVGEGGKRIGKVKSWVLRCHACFK